MKIGIVGSQNVGKSTFINDFIANWPMYKVADNSYREKIKKDPNFKLNKEGNRESQIMIRDCMIDQAQAYKKDDDILFDRCIIDNFIYGLWLNVKGKGDIDDLFIEQQIPILKETLKLYDIIFYIPILDKYPIEIVPSVDGQRCLDPEYRLEIDNLFKALMSDYYKESRTFFPNEDCPALIEIFGSREERIEIAKLYIKTNGKPYGDEDSLIKDIVYN